MPWDGGVFVTCAPDLLYLKDTTGDGVADERRVVLTGFDATPHRADPLQSSDAGHRQLDLPHQRTQRRPRRPRRIIPSVRPSSSASSDSRFNPLTRAFELAGGQGQYGLTFDDQGRRFTCSNRHPVMHVVLEPR